MKIVAVVNNTSGEVLYTFIPSDDEDAYKVQPPEGTTAVVLDETYAGVSFENRLYVDGTFVERPPRPSRFHQWNREQWEWVLDFQEMLEHCRNEIDFAAGKARAKYITIAAGQEATYSAKYDQAIRFLNAEDPDVDEYPWIKLEAIATGMTPVACATRIKELGDLWANVLGPSIEAIRVAGKDVLETMGHEDYATIRAHVDSVLAQLDAV